MKRTAADMEDRSQHDHESKHDCTIFTQSLLMYRRRQATSDTTQLHEDEVLLPCGCSEDIGKREAMEDRHVRVQLRLPSSSPLSAARTLHLLAVFDGHGTDKAADFLRSNASEFITSELRGGEDDAAALTRAFVALDAALAASYVRSNPLLEMGGSTALVVLCSEDKIICANCGDSRAVLARGGYETVPLSIDHKPDRADELARIQQAGGCVLNRNGGPRVMGILAMSRAIGDTLLQQYGVTPVPEVHVMNRSIRDEFLILASDGLWGVMSNQEAVEIARRCLQRAAIKGANAAASARIAAKVLLRTAFSRGNCDNITVMVADVGGPQQGSEPGLQARARQQAAAELPAVLSLGSTDHGNLRPTVPVAPMTPSLTSPPAPSMQHLCLP